MALEAAKRPHTIQDISNMHMYKLVIGVTYFKYEVRFDLLGFWRMYWLQRLPKGLIPYKEYAHDYVGIWGH